MKRLQLVLFLLFLAGTSSITATELYSLAPGSAAEPCNSQTYYREWSNTFGYPIYIKKLWVWNGASAGMIADIHTTVWRTNADNSDPMVVQIVPWDRYDRTPKDPAVEDMGDNHITLLPGQRLVWGAACTVLGVDQNPPSSFYFHYQTKISYTRY